MGRAGWWRVPPDDGTARADHGPGNDQHPVTCVTVMIRITGRLRADLRIARFTVEAASDESIHDYGAFARLSWPPDR
jgi:hypothetical protein